MDGPQRGQPTPEFYRYMIALLGLAGGDANLTIDQLNALVLTERSVNSRIDALRRDVADLAAFVLTGRRAASSVIGLTAIPNNDVLANISGASAIPVGVGVSALLDAVFGNAQGDILYRDAGAWMALAPGVSGQLFGTQGPGANPRWVTAATGAGSVVLITETVTSASQATVTFSAIPGTYRDLEIRVRGRGDTAANNAEVRCQFNSDSGANQYSTQVLDGTAASVTTTALNETSVRLGLLPAASATAGYNGLVTAWVGDYRGTTFEKSTIGLTSAAWNNAGSAFFARLASGRYHSSNAITSASVFLSAGNFVNNSVVSLYGSY